MYGIAGERRLTEFELDWLPGYEGSKPVRVGNAASGQFQLDVYGEVIVVHLRRRGSMGLPGRDEGLAHVQAALVEFLEKAWQRPDDGIWEVRGGRRHFTHSKVMAWVAIDRLGEGDRRSSALAATMAGACCRTLRRCASASTPRSASAASTPRVGAFTQSYGSEHAGRERSGDPALRVPAGERPARR